MATATDISLCSTALVALGAKAISSFTDGTDRSKLCGTLYPIVKNDILSRYDWKFTIKKKQLSRLTESPVSQWTYKFQIPSDALTGAPIALFTTSQAGAPPLLRFEVKAEGIYCDETALFMDYQVNNTDEANWPPYFQNLIVQAMRAALCWPVTRQSTETQRLEQVVYGTPQEAGMGGLVRACRIRNSRENPPIPIVDFPLLTARAEGF